MPQAGPVHDPLRDFWGLGARVTPAPNAPLLLQAISPCLHPVCLDVGSSASPFNMLNLTLLKVGEVEGFTQRQPQRPGQASLFPQRPHSFNNLGPPLPFLCPDGQS